MYKKVASSVPMKLQLSFSLTGIRNAIGVWFRCVQLPANTRPHCVSHGSDGGCTKRSWAYRTLHPGMCVCVWEREGVSICERMSEFFCVLFVCVQQK